MTATNKTADRFRQAAERLAREAERLRLPRLDNTPKRQREAASRAIEASRLDRIRDALLKLADAHEAGAVPEAFRGFKGKSDLLPMLTTRIDHSGGYYSLRDTGEYHDQTEVARSFRAWLDGGETAETREAKERQARADRVAELERAVRFQNIPGFFPTPPAVIARMLELADLRPGMTVLEPSAGKGDIVDAILADGACPVSVSLYEYSHTLCDILKAKGYAAEAADFLAVEPPAGGFDRVIMNPPFEGLADIDHVLHAFDFLKPGGRLVAVMSAGPFFRSGKKAEDFRHWLKVTEGERVELPDDAFAQGFRQTGTKTCLVVIDCPELGQPPEPGRLF